jgi:hypothetical protein
MHRVLASGGGPYQDDAVNLHPHGDAAMVDKGPGSKSGAKKPKGGPKAGDKKKR